jgi:hypothetical protein
MKTRLFFRLLMMLLQASTVFGANNADDDTNTTATLINCPPGYAAILSPLCIQLHVTNPMFWPSQLETCVTITKTVSPKAQGPLSTTVKYTSAHGKGAYGKATYEDFYLASPDFKATNIYKVTVVYPSGPPVSISVTNDPQVSGNPDKLLGFFATSTNSQGSSYIQASPLAGNGNATGFQYALSLNAWSKENKGVSLTSSGEISTESGTNKLLQALNIGVKLFNQPDIMLSSDYRMPFGYILKPIDFEATQDFKTVDHTTKLELYCAIPGSEWIQGGWNRFAYGKGNPKSPSVDSIALTTGYTFSYDISTNVNRTIPTGPANHRWDSKLKYTFHFFKDLDVDTSYNSYVGVNHGFYRQTVDVKPILYLINTDSRTNKAGFFLEYTRGESPPAFIPAKSNFRFGITGKW